MCFECMMKMGKNNSAHMTLGVNGVMELNYLLREKGAVKGVIMQGHSTAATCFICVITKSGVLKLIHTRHVPEEMSLLCTMIRNQFSPC